MTFAVEKVSFFSEERTDVLETKVDDPSRITLLVGNKYFLSYYRQLRKPENRKGLYVYYQNPFNYGYSGE